VAVIGIPGGPEEGKIVPVGPIGRLGNEASVLREVGKEVLFDSPLVVMGWVSASQPARPVTVVNWDDVYFHMI
jgi:hypothetical protein